MLADAGHESTLAFGYIDLVPILLASCPMTHSRFRGSFVFCLAVLIGALGGVVDADEATLPPLKVGAAEVKITPAKPESVYLFPVRGAATGVNDDIYARALVLAQGDERAVIVTLDLISMSIAYSERLAAAIEKATGITADRVVINCSHTHNAPLPGRVAWQKSDKDDAYANGLPEKVAAVVRSALEQITPVMLRVDREVTQFAFNRRLPDADGHVTMAPNPLGSHIPWVDVLGAYDLQGKRIALLFSHAAHPVVVHATSTNISADYPGFAVRRLKLKLAVDGQTDGVFMFAQGCGGDINGFPLRGGYEACRVVGRTLAHAVLRCNLKPLPPGKLTVRSQTLALPLQSPPPIAEVKALLARYPDDQRYRDLLKIAQSGEPRTLPFPMRSISIGQELCIVALPHEMFSAYQLWIDENSPYKHNLVFGYSNGVESYVAMRRDYELGDLGGYEAAPRGAALNYNHRLTLRPEAEELIKAGVRALWKEE